MSTDLSEVRAAMSLIALMMEAARTSETSVDIQLITRQYIQKILKFNVYVGNRRLLRSSGSGEGK
jgi:hypothetical protein